MVEFDAGTHAYSLNGKTIPSVTQVISFGKSERFYTIGAAERGTRVHRVIELFDMGELPQSYITQTRELPIGQLLQIWAKWRIDEQVDIISCEQKLSAEIDGLAFAGTLDRIVGIGDEIILLDLKTGRPYPGEHGQQVQAYRYLWEAAGHPPIDHCGCAYLRPEGLTIRYYNDAGFLEKFKAKLAAYWAAQPKDAT